MTEVHFYHAMWCHSCPQVAKVFREIRGEINSSNIHFVDIDVETEEGIDLSSFYQVRNVPTILIIKNKRVVERIVGTRTKQELKDIIEKWE